MSGNHNTKSNDDERLLNAELLADHWQGRYYAQEGMAEQYKKRIAELEKALEQQGEQQPHECTRSHPHELMDGYCQLRTEIARLTNENARLKAAAQKVDIPARAEVEFARLTGEIQRLAVSIWSSDFRSESPHWTVLPDAFGALSQISNMVAGMERKAAPAAQPTCKQDLPVETTQERYVRLCPDIECGRKKRCTRMVGVSCMSRADIDAAPAAQHSCDQSESGGPRGACSRD